MSFFRIGNVGLLITPSVAHTVALSAPITYPDLATGILGINTHYASADWGRDQMMIDVMRSARDWRAQTASEFNNTTLQQQMMATADVDGYPTELPAGVIQAGTLLMTEQGTETVAVFGGRYRLEWQGSGTVVVSGSNQTSGANWIEFDFSPTASNLIDVRITAITPGNHIRAMRCYQTAHATLLSQGKIVHPAWSAAYPNIKLLRFMLAQGTNENLDTDWSQAAKPSTICRGISVREMVSIANELGCDMWLCVPCAATTDYVTQMATVVRDNLNPALKCYVEYANEWWNWASGYVTAPYLDALRAGKSYNWAEMAGGRSAEVMQAWSAVFAGQMSRTIRVGSMQTNYLGLEDGFLNAPGWVAEQAGRPVPHTLLDAITVTGYFGISTSQWAEVITAAEGNYTTGRDLAISYLEADIEELRNTRYPHFRSLADSLGKLLVMYEGGTHFYNPGTTNNALANQIVAEVNRGPLAAPLLTSAIEVWELFGDGPWCHFSSCERPVDTGEFGALQYINQVDSPRHGVLMDYNDGTLFPAITPLPLNQRIILNGHSIPDAIARTPLQDAISAMGGTIQRWSCTGPHATAQFRWENRPVAPDEVRGLMEAPGASYDAFVGIEAYGGSYGGRASVVEHIRWSSAYAYALLWHNLAASTGAQPYYANFWRDDPGQTFDAAWKNSHSVIVWDGSGFGNTAAANLTELQAWDSIIDYVNANKAPGTPDMRLVPWLQVFLAVYDGIQAGTVTGISMSDVFNDSVHTATVYGRWIQIATLLLVVYRRHPDELPANAGTLANIPEGLAAQLRPIVWATCLNTARTGLS